MNARTFVVHSTRLEGTVQSFNAVHGYGFIRPDVRGQDVFMHVRRVRLPHGPSIVPGMRVSYLLESDASGAKRPQAIDVAPA